MSLVPMKFGISWLGGQYLVVVTIYNGDGSVSVAHGGIECGQGVNTKVTVLNSLLSINVPYCSVRSV